MLGTFAFGLPFAQGSFCLDKHPPDIWNCRIVLVRLVQSRRNDRNPIADIIRWELRRLGRGIVWPDARSTVGREGVGRGHFLDSMLRELGLLCFPLVVWTKRLTADQPQLAGRFTWQNMQIARAIRQNLEEFLRTFPMECELWYRAYCCFSARLVVALQSEPAQPRRREGARKILRGVSLARRRAAMNVQSRFKNIFSRGYLEISAVIAKA